MVRPGSSLTASDPHDHGALAEGVADLVVQAQLDQLDSADFTALTLAVLQMTLGADLPAVAGAAAGAAAQLGRSPQAKGALVQTGIPPSVWWEPGPDGPPVDQAALDDVVAAALAGTGLATGSGDGWQLVAAPVPTLPGHPGGVLVVARPEEEGPFSPRQEALLALLGRLVSAGLDHAGRLAQERAARRSATDVATWQARLAGSSEALTGALGTAEVLAALEAAVLPDLADAIAVAIRSGDDIEVVHLRHRLPERERLLRAVADNLEVRLSHPVGSGAVIASGQPQLLPEITDELLATVAQTEEQLDQLRSLTLVSGVIVPLKARGSTIGALSLIRDEGERYTEAELSFALALAERAGLAIESTMRFEAERALAEELRQNLEVRGRVEAILLGQRDVFAQVARGELLERILDTVCRSVEGLSPPGVRAAVAVLDDSGTRLIDAAGPSLPAALRHALHDLPLAAAGGPPTAAVVSGQAQHCESIEDDTRWGPHRQAAVDEGLHRCWAFPIRSSTGRALGSFMLYSPRTVEASHVDQRVTDIFVESAAIAIERERDREALIAQRSLVQSVLEQMPAGVMVVSLPKGQLVLANGPARRWFSLDDSGSAAADESPVTAHPVLGPVLAGVIDASDVLQGEELTIDADGPDGAELTLLVTAGPVRNRNDEAVAAVATFHDITRRKRTERRMAAQHAVSDVLASAGPDVDVGPIVLESLGSTLGWSAGCLWAVDPDGEYLLCTATWTDGRPAAQAFVEASRRHRFGLGRGVPGRAWQEEGAVWVDDLTAFDDFPRLEAAHHAGLRRAVAAPILLRGRVRGIIEMYGSERMAEDAELLAAMAAIGNQLGVHLERRQVEHNLRVSRQRFADLATTLQTSLLPPALPEIPGAELAAYYRAGESGVEVGGDFYDMFEMAGRDWLLVIGDVCGKGAEAATVTALARFTLRGAAMRTRRLPAVLESLNQAVLRHPTDLFCTVTLVRVRQDGDALSLQVACAGHPRPHLLRPDGSVAQVGGTGPLIGVVRDHSSESEAVRLEPGASLMLYTDGLVEARSPTGEFYGQDRLRSTLAGVAGEPADSVIDAVSGDLRSFERDRRDDVAMVVLRARPPA